MEIKEKNTRPIIKIKRESGGLYAVWEDDYRHTPIYGNFGRAQRFARKLAQNPAGHKHEWTITKNSNHLVQKSGPKWWMWVLMILGTIALMAISV